jgi:hypothetical protein
MVTKFDHCAAFAVNELFLQADVFYTDDGRELLHTILLLWGEPEKYACKVNRKNGG